MKMNPTENQIKTMALKGYTITEYNGADGRVSYTTSCGELRSSRKLSALLSNIRKSLLSKEKQIQKKQEAALKQPIKQPKDINNISVIKFLNSQNLKLIEAYHGLDDTYNIHCEKHNITIKRRLCNMNIVGRKINSLCPECRKEEYVQYYNSLGLAPNVTILDWWMSESRNNHKVMKCQCKYCNHTFNRYLDDIKQGVNDCPKCGIFRKKNLPHLYEKYETYREECDRFTTINITRFKDNIKPIEGLSVDHRFSCRNGYDNHIPPWIVAMPYNLEWIPMVENNIKSKKNSMNISELFVSFGEFLKEYPWYGESFDKSFGNK